MRKDELIADKWIRINKSKIISNITSEFNLFNDRDVIDIVSMFSYNDDISEFPFIFFNKLIKEIFMVCSRERHSEKQFLKAIQRAARLSCLSDYTNIFKEDLLENFPYSAYEKILIDRERFNGGEY